MPVVNKTEYLELIAKAKAGNFAYPAINVVNLEGINAALEGFQEAKSDGFIQFSLGGGAHATGSVKDSVLGAKILAEAIKRSFRKITVFLSFVLIFSLIISSLMYVIEGPKTGFTSIPQSIYWTIVTITTVGYGDISPQTPVGKFLASVLMLIGYGIIAVPTGLVTVDLYSIYNQNLSQTSKKYCSNCLDKRHDIDAKYCKYCGQILLLNKS